MMLLLLAAMQAREPRLTLTAEDAFGAVSSTRVTLPGDVVKMTANEIISTYLRPMLGEVRATVK